MKKGAGETTKSPLKRELRFGGDRFRMRLICTCARTLWLALLLSLMKPSDPVLSLALRSSMLRRLLFPPFG